MTDEIWKRAEVQSPCVKICVIEPKSRLCTGCLRSIDEIASWGSMTSETRARILAELPARQPLLTRRRGGRKGRLGEQ
ncbi:DUF1289 domain-containing protein [Salipiger sp. IMCC34102]|uniref:DUF1289 domain-containing protein n=1 Tax=Salipiger sp. IMCC34102 TaxID=2510647 RepID=UPI00101D32FC|nr:DUF1289 domain-containing protein [Salipiger sp. IMCC34102]RYH03339.1 DUF1289 domain-containing protein [Salipiger sp. IMCC34102]